MANNGSMVKVHYTGTLGDGSVFDSSLQREPLEFKLGCGQVIPGFEEAVLSMNAGETKTVTIPADQAYGQRHEELVLVVEIEKIPAELNPKVGDKLQMRQPNGAPVAVVVTEMTEKTITLDANHALAGKDLTFELTLVEEG
ncbi:MAG: peptidylprolyl isomerase [Dehalococcoidales bacterium]|nr:peptidylprolyl isomerase [Dehalococcoidales bacterium]